MEKDNQKIEEIVQGIRVKNPNKFIKPGQCLNPKGRPKGAISNARKKFNAIVNHASNDALTVYHELRRHMLAGESWAYNIYFKDLIPKKCFEQTVCIDDSKERAEALKDAINEFTDLTHDQLLKEIFATKSLELISASKTEQDVKLLTLLTTEQLKTIDQWVQEKIK